MKTNIVFLLIFFSVCLSTVAQPVAFTVTGVKGLAKADNSPLKIGAKIKNNQTVKLEQNSYLSLATTDNRVLEVTAKGAYSVTDLLTKVPKKQSLSASYVEFVVDELTKGSEDGIAAKNRFQHMNKTGSVKRDINMGANSGKKSYQFSFLIEKIEAPDHGLLLFGNTLDIDWAVVQDASAEKINAYEVEILNLEEVSIFSQTVNQPSISIDLSMIDLKNQEGILFRVTPLNSMGEAWDASRYDLMINLLNDAQKQEVAAKLPKGNTPMMKLAEAKFLEDQKYYLDAIYAYKQAIKMGNNDPIYETLYYRFWLRHEPKK
jgi:hypothetical protein